MSPRQSKSKLKAKSARRLLAAVLAGTLVAPVTSVSGIAGSGQRALAADTAIRSLDGCDDDYVYWNDDDSSDYVPLSSDLNFFGEEYSGLYVNNNGNVTFDGPLFDYTPSDIPSQGRVMIAPFWADVDTRDSEPVYYGMTMVDGRRALCVTWSDVGYYDEHSDKLNSFQLLLIDRSDVVPGDFDIEMNYGSIEWETGDASDGFEGVGGIPAYAGYSNGTGLRFFQLSGSGISGAFLDSDSTGLIHGSRSSTTLGRYSFAVRNGRPDAINRYVALGDSLASGEGVPPFDADPSTGKDHFCHRSTYAYARTFADLEGLKPPRLFACTGAKIRHFSHRQNSGLFGLGSGNERPQLERLSLETTDLVTLSIGVNDVGFAKILRGCAVAFRCQGEASEPTAAVIDGLADDLLGLHRKIDSRVRLGSRVYVVGYPQIFNADRGFCSLGFQKGEREFFRSATSQLNDVIEQTVNVIRQDASTNAYFQYVDMENELDEGQLCSNAPKNQLMFHGASLSHREFSYHPNRSGQGEMARVLAEAVGS